MTVNYTTLLGLAEPVTGTQSGTWGDDVNKGITDYLDIAIAGTQTISGTQTAVTLSITNGSSAASNIAQVASGATGSAQYQIINCTGGPVSLLTITAPASSKTYVVINSTSTSQSVQLVAPGPTTGVTIVSGEKAFIVWNGSDFTKVASSTADGVTTFSAGTTGFTPSTGTTGAVTLAGTLGAANGGTGQTAYTTGDIIYAPSTNTVGKLGIGSTNQVLTVVGGVPAWAASTGGVTSFSAGTTGFTPSTGTTGAVTLAGTLGVANGGTGQTSYTDGQLLIGNTTGNTLAKATLTQGTGITITNGAGTITIASSGGGGGAGSNLYLAVNFGGF
jgi:hypothetical protein